MDMAEEEGLSRVLGCDVPTVATKALWGETFGAAGALSLVAALVWLEGIEAAPLLRGTPRRDVRHVLITALGYYGNVSAVIVRKANEG
jgi:3-oxoacyl-(acyl-carrier-protein) synthase